MSNVDVLVVGGGGNGSNNDGDNLGGGGGGGKVDYRTSFALAPGTYPVTIGGSNQDSIFSTITAERGNNSYGTSGASSANGHTGGAASGNGAGGGGAGDSANGGNASGDYGGNGGDGTPCSISGTTKYYGAGGGGAGWFSLAEGGSGVGGTGGKGSTGTSPTNGVANSGSGGGGTAQTGNLAYGGSGIVIIRYLTGTAMATGGTITHSGEYTIHTFTSSGTFSIVFGGQVIIWGEE
jgi:hypothetical protein